MTDLRLETGSASGDPSQKLQPGSRIFSLGPLPLLALWPLASCCCQGLPGLGWAVEPMASTELTSRHQDAWLTPAPHHRAAAAIRWACQACGPLPGLSRLPSEPQPGPFPSLGLALAAHPLSFHFSQLSASLGALCTLFLPGTRPLLTRAWSLGFSGHLSQATPASIWPVDTGRG